MQASRTASGNDYCKQKRASSLPIATVRNIGPALIEGFLRFDFNFSISHY
jgi:hypothetical protein